MATATPLPFTINTKTKKFVDTGDNSVAPNFSDVLRLIQGEENVLALTFLTGALTAESFNPTDTFRLRVDIDFTHVEYSGTLDNAESGAQTSIVATYSDTGVASLNSTGALILRRATDAGSRERVPYTAASIVDNGDGTYTVTFTVNKTLTNSYLAGDHCDVEDPFMVDSSDSDFNRSGDWSGVDVSAGKLSAYVDCSRWTFQSKYIANVAANATDLAVKIEIDRFTATSTLPQKLLQDVIYARGSVGDVEGTTIPTGDAANDWTVADARYVKNSAFSTAYALANVPAAASGLEESTSLFTDAAGNLNVGTSAAASGAKLTVNGEASIDGIMIGGGAGTGAKGTRVGASAAASVTSAARFVAMGAEAASVNTIGTNWTAIGNAAAKAAAGSRFTVFGAAACSGISTGDNFIGIGYAAGYYQSGSASVLTSTSGSVFLGALTKGTQSAGNEIVIGYAANGRGANTAQWGSTSIIKHYMSGALLVNSSALAGSEKLNVGGDVYIGSKILHLKSTSYAQFKLESTAQDAFYDFTESGTIKAKVGWDYSASAFKINVSNPSFSTDEFCVDANGIRVRTSSQHGSSIVTVSGDVYSDTSFSLGDDKYIYLRGDESTNDSIRMSYQSGSDKIIFEARDSGSWTSKHEFSMA